MDAETARILRQLIEVQLKQAELLRRLISNEANRQMGMHLRIAHGGDWLHKLQDEFDRQNDQIGAALDRNQEELGGLVVELCKAPATAS